MKELSIEQKAKAYDEALKVLHKYDGAHIMFTQDLKEEMFPELKEDERIRNLLYCLIRDRSDNGKLLEHNGVSADMALAWLEKQGKSLRQRADVIIANMLDDKIDGIQRELIEFAANAIEAPWLEIIKSADCYAQRIRNIIDEQDEQKSADKVESKFHEGDWVVNTITNNVEQIIEVTSNEYICSGNLIVSFDNQHLLRKWTIQDAKDGDILADGNLPFILKKIDTNKYSYAYCGISVDAGFKIVSDGESGAWTWMQDIKPATKEQRDQLEKAMVNAGYKWNKEGRKLEKIEQESVWSEDDEDYRFDVNVAIDDLYDEGYAEKLRGWLKSLKERIQVQPKQEWSEEDAEMFDAIIADIKFTQSVHINQVVYEREIDWLKYIRDRIKLA